MPLRCPIPARKHPLNRLLTGNQQAKAAAKGSANGNLGCLLSLPYKINPSKKVISSHTGLENVTQILGLYYANRYELKKEETGGFYKVELNMLLEDITRKGISETD